MRIRTPRGTLAGTLFAPPRKKLRDVGTVLFLHGREDDRWMHWYPALYARLVRAGMGVLAIEVNGHGESYGRFEGFTYAKGLKDAEDSIRWLRNKGARRIGVAGFSQGGGLALLAASRNPGILCTLLVAPVALPNYVHSAFGPLPKAFQKDIERHASFFAEAERIHAPVLIIQGTKDDAIPLFHTTKLQERLGTEPHLKRLRLVQGADHVFSAAKDRAILLREGTAFLARIVGRSIVPIVKAAVLHEGRLLLMKRSAAVADFPLYWDVPSGYLGDEPHAGRKILEEIEEETGIPRALLQIAEHRRMERFSERRGVTYRIHLFRIESDTARIQLNWENVAYRWVDSKKLPRAGVRPHLKSLLKELDVA